MGILFAPYFRAADQANQPIPGAFLTFYATGTSTLQPIWAEYTLSIPLANPQQADGNGVFSAIWLDESLPAYKAVLQYPDVNNPSIPGAIVAGPNGTIDPYNSTLSANAIGQQLYPVTAAELVAAALPGGLMPVNFTFAPLDQERYATNTAPGVTSMAAALQNAINVAKQTGGVIPIGDGPYLYDAPFDLTFPVGSQNCNFAIIGRGRFKAATNTQNVTQTPSIILKHTGHAFDTTGSGGVHFENLSICTDDAVYPQTCFLLARSSAGNSRSDRIINCYVLGRFSKTILYNYGAENGVYSGNQFYNISADSDTSVFDITGFNTRVLSSTFTTIAVGSQSCLDHKIIAGEYANLFQGSGTAADVFRLDGARSVKIIGPWLDSSAKNGASSGRSLIYIDGVHGPSAAITLLGLNGEAATFPAQYGILFSATASTHSNIVVIGCTFPNVQYMIGGGTTATLTQLTWLNNTNESQGGGINFTGTLAAPCLIDWSANVTGSIITNETWNANQGIRVAGEANYTLTDATQAVGAKMWKLRNASAQLSFYRCDDGGTPNYTPLIMTTSGLGFNNTAPIAKPAVTGSRGGNAALASLLTQLAAYGLITDSSS